MLRSCSTGREFACSSNSRTIFTVSRDCRSTPSAKSRSADACLASSSDCLRSSFSSILTGCTPPGAVGMPRHAFFRFGATPTPQSSRVFRSAVVSSGNCPHAGFPKERTLMAGLPLQQPPLANCPQCHSTRLEPFSEDEEMHFLCRNCGRCWHVELGRAHAIDPSHCNPTATRRYEPSDNEDASGHV